MGLIEVMSVIKTKKELTKTNELLEKQIKLLTEIKALLEKRF